MNEQYIAMELQFFIFFLPTVAWKLTAQPPRLLCQHIILNIDSFLTEHFRRKINWFRIWKSKSYHVCTLYWHSTKSFFSIFNYSIAGKQSFSEFLKSFLVYREKYAYRTWKWHRNYLGMTGGMKARNWFKWNPSYWLGIYSLSKFVWKSKLSLWAGFLISKLCITL